MTMSISLLLNLIYQLVTSGTLVLTGAYRETPEITGQQAQVSAGTQNLFKIQKMPLVSQLFMTPKQIIPLAPCIPFIHSRYIQLLILLFGTVLFRVLQFVILNPLKPRWGMILREMD